MKKNHFLISRHCSLLIGLIFGVIPLLASAWDGHSLLTFAALKNSPELMSQQPIIPAEPLSSFLNKEQTGLADLLRENESWAKTHIYAYPPLPKNMVFKVGGDQSSLQQRFMHALRINPNLTLPLFVQYLPGQPHRIHHSPLKEDQVMLPGVAASAWVHPNPPFESVATDELVSPLEIISTAADEPDYGLDIDLFEDNKPGIIGKLYQWGNQPFGDSNFSLGSQAPFHMGFYYEPSIIYKMSSLKRSYPEYRIHTYLELSKFAFNTGHPYWGYRFLGWAVHYIQDLSQPYHSTSTPGSSTSAILFKSLLDKVGIHSPIKNVLTLLSNRHFSLENYLYYFFDYTFSKDTKNEPLIQAITDKAHDSTYPPYSDVYARVVAKESHDMANTVDNDLKKGLPSKYVNDTNYIFYTTENTPPNLYLMANNKPSTALEALNRQLVILLRAVGSHTRNVIRYAIEK